MKLVLLASSVLAAVQASTIGLSPRSEDFSNLAQAVQHWQSGQECHPAYFTRTNTTLALSDQALYYKKWHKFLHANNPRTQRKVLTTSSLGPARVALILIARLNSIRDVM